MRGFTSLSTAAFALVRRHKTMRTLPIRSSTSTSSSHHHLSYSQILKQRRAVRNFDSQREVTTDILLKILKESQSAPSSFNLQPYKVIVVRSKAQREALSKAMIGFNVQRVLNAPVTVVILADKYGSANTRKLIELEKKKQWTPHVHRSAACHGVLCAGCRQGFSVHQSNYLTHFVTTEANAYARE